MVNETTPDVTQSREAVTAYEATYRNMLAIVRGQMSNHSHDYARGWLNCHNLQARADAEAERSGPLLLDVVKWHEDHARLIASGAFDAMCVAHGANREIEGGSYCHDTDVDGYCDDRCPDCTLLCPLCEVSADAEAERDRLHEALLGTAERRLTDSDDSPCWCIDAPWVGHASPYSTNGSEHDDFCAKARAALNPEDKR